MLKKIFAVSALSFAAFGLASAPAMAGTGHYGYGHNHSLVNVYAPVDVDVCGVLFIGNAYCW